MKQNIFIDFTSTITPNSTYIDPRHFYKFYKNNNLIVFSINFQAIKDIPVGVTLFSGLPFYNTQLYGSLAGANSKAIRTTLVRGIFSFEDAGTAQWYDGQMIIPVF